MNTALIIALAALAIGAIALVAYLIRLNRRARGMDNNIDYSKIRKWDDEDDGR